MAKPHSSNDWKLSNVPKRANQTPRSHKQWHTRSGLYANGDGENAIKGALG
jgi:hypothetical protein